MSMEHRTWGKSKNCKGCRYWSERVSEANGVVVSALCLTENSPNHGRMTTGGQGCGAWASGTLGAIDDPSGDPYAE